MLHAFAAHTLKIKYQLNLQPAVSGGPGWLMPGKGALMATAAGPADHFPSSRHMRQLKSSVRLLPLAACTAAAERAGSPAQPPLASRHASSTLTAR